MITATLRTIDGQTHDTTIDRLTETDEALVAFAAVDGIGHVAVRHLADRGWGAFLVQPPGRLSDREIRWVDGVAEVEVLPNPSGEDRLVVCFGGLPERATAEVPA